METIWFLFALGASMLYASVNKLDEGLLRFFAKEEKKEPVVTLIMFSSMSAIVMLIVLGFIAAGDIFPGTIIQTVSLAGTGVLTIVAIILYLYALNEEGASTVVPIFQTVPVFGYGLGYLILGETLEQPQIIAGLVVILAAMFISLELGERARLKFQTLFLMFGSSFLYALADVLYKRFALNDAGFIVGSFWRFAGYLSVGPFLYLVPRYRADFQQMLFERKTLLPFTLGGEGVYQLGDLIVNYTLLLAPVSIVLLALSFQPVFVLIFGIALAKSWPRLFTEEMSRKSLVQKITAVTIMIIASRWLIS